MALWMTTTLSAGTLKKWRMSRLDDSETVRMHAERLAADHIVARVRERFQLQQRFVLYAGNIKPHKNLERLIEAFHALRRADLDDLKLLIIGDQISKYPALRRAVHRLKLHKHVRFLGYLPDDTLAILYRLAAVFVFPSLYEGFGLPALEAMASGTPVVTSNVSSLPEVTGDAAVLVDPYDVDAIEAGMRRVLTDPQLADEMRRKGLRRAREFSWERSVAKTWQVYQEIGAQGQATGALASGVPSADDDAQGHRATLP
jgi:glycosyltransferase involved in cell wall biosynthesis